MIVNRHFEHPVRQLRSCLYLAGVSFRRLVKSRQTMVSLLLLAFAVLAVIAWSLRRERTALEFTEEILLPVYVSFLLPVFCLCYGTASICGDREERTLVYLLVTPLPRPLIHLAKFVAALLLTLAWTLGGMAILCRMAGPAGREPFQCFWPAALCATLAYVSLFHLFSVVFYRATIIALAYALFLETFVGNMPGIVKRLAITFYTRCLIFDAGSPLGIEPAGGQNPGLYLPVSGQTAYLVLWVLAGILFLLGTLLFSRREYV
jgi:ABC-type transport system involved in multi-copper enzyme maturation permease subunit